MFVESVDLTVSVRCFMFRSLCSCTSMLHWQFNSFRVPHYWVRRVFSKTHCLRCFFSVLSALRPVLIWLIFGVYSSFLCLCASLPPFLSLRLSLFLGLSKKRFSPPSFFYWAAAWKTAHHFTLGISLSRFCGCGIHHCCWIGCCCEECPSRFALILHSVTGSSIFKFHIIKRFYLSTRVSPVTRFFHVDAHGI